MARREFPAKVKGIVALRAGGRCEGCGIKLRFGEGHYDHKQADGLGGEPTVENCQLLCVPCHKVKTDEDVRIMRKADRQRKVAEGRKARKGPPMPGSKASKWKRRVDGTVERRT